MKVELEYQKDAPKTRLFQTRTKDGILISMYIPKDMVKSGGFVPVSFEIPSGKKTKAKGKAVEEDDEDEDIDEEDELEDEDEDEEEDFDEDEDEEPAPKKKKPTSKKRR